MDVDFESSAIDADEENTSPVEQEEKLDKSIDEPQKGKNVNKFPTARIRNIMKMDPDLTIASQESVFVITKAAELFVQLQAKEAYKRTVVAKRKTVQRRDLDTVLDELDCMAFLEGALDVEK